MSNKKIRIGHRDAEIRVRSVRFTPKGFDKMAKIIFAIFGYSGESGVLPGCSQSDLRMISERPRKCRIVPTFHEQIQIAPTFHEKIQIAPTFHEKIY